MLNKAHLLAVGLSIAASLAGNAGCGKQETVKPVVESKKDADVAKGEPSPKLPDTLPQPPNLHKFEMPPLPSVLGQSPSDKKPAAQEKKPIVVTARKDRARPTETVALAAQAFAMEISKSADDAARKYENAFVELTGTVRTVGSRDRDCYITLDAGPESLGIMCWLAKESEPWAKISKGQKVKLRGQWPDLFVQPSLEACELVELGANPAIEMTAESLAADFVKSKEAIRAKYHEKPLIVTGMVVSMTRNELGAVRLFLKGAGEMRVDCGFNANDRAEAEAQPTGKTIRVVGEISSFESSDAPALRGCRVITQKQ